MRALHVVANWKMNMLAADVRAFFAGLGRAQGERGPWAPNHALWIAPQAVHLHAVLAGLRSLGAGRPAAGRLAAGAQDCAPRDAGAFTGDLSPAGLADAGASFVLVGHSERRRLHGEGDALLGEKARAALGSGLSVVFCVGETLEEREAGRAESVVAGQLGRGLAGVRGDGRLLVAYEPVWAIGTGRTASPGDAQAMHRFIRGALDAPGAPGRAADVPLLYGGSVTPKNAGDLLGRPDVDGALVGGASLSADSLGEICRAAERLAAAPAGRAALDAPRPPR